MYEFVRKYILFIVTFFAMVIALILCFTWIPKNDLKIHFLDVGQGDATLVQSPLGRNILIDAGAVGAGVEYEMSKFMHPNDRTIDLLILTHPDLDHVGGALEILKNYNVKMVLHSGLLAGSDVYELVAMEINKQHIPAVQAEVGQVIHIDTRTSFNILSPYSDMESFESNDYSIVLQLVYGDSKALLMGDATKYIEHQIEQVFSENLQSQILKVGHHGSQTSTTDSFIETVQPTYGVISAGCGNRFGHPHTEVLVTLMQNNVEILDTCKQGSISFKGNGIDWSYKK